MEIFPPSGPFFTSSSQTKQNKKEFVFYVYLAKMWRSFGFVQVTLTILIQLFSGEQHREANKSRRVVPRHKQVRFRQQKNI